jgi:hypothetical protein
MMIYEFKFTFISLLNDPADSRDDAGIKSWQQADSPAWMRKEEKK